jgi:Asp-tRNA(Asn)/Glu-tRNA(Gln) amidotransferase A subunit family amidase
MPDPLELSLAEAGELLSDGDVSSLELTELVLARIEETEPRVHAYAHVLGDHALAAARRADAELAAGSRRSPLHGVPIGVKDIIALRGAPLEAGSRVLAGNVADRNATVVVKLEEAGAVIVGKTVTMEFAWGTNVPVTRSPWRNGCYPGGSSAGSGVAVAMRSAFAAIGTDTGGSVRIPAAINGLVGLKPTFGRVSRSGVLPLSWSLDHVGTLTRTVEDAGLVLQALSGYDAADAGSIAEPVPDLLAELENGVDELVIGVERAHHFYTGVSRDVRNAVEGVLAEYSRLGARIVEVELPEFEVMPAVLLTILLAEASTIHRTLLRNHVSDYDPTTRLMLELGELEPATHYLTALRARTLMKQRVRALFEECELNVLLSPTIPLPTVPNELRNVSVDGGEAPFTSYVHHTFSANLLGLPALSVPCGLTADGLPIGFQVLGRPFSERTVFRVARAYEREHRWRELRPPEPGE